MHSIYAVLVGMLVLVAFAQDDPGEPVPVTSAAEGVDAQCNAATGTNLGFAMMATSPSRICEQMGCYTSFKPTGAYKRIYIVPKDGTICGNKMWCEDKKCVKNENAPAVDDIRCPHGENVGMCALRYLTCSQTITYCCKRCPRTDRAIAID